MRRTLERYRARGPSVTVGIQGTEASSPRRLTPGAKRSTFGDSNVRLAAVHEFGSRDGKVPQRSFIRATVDRNRGVIRRLLERAAKEAVATGSAARGLGIVGERVKAEMTRTIDQSIGLKALAQSTKDRKGSSRPLIDTGQLKGAISWKVHGA